MYILGINGGVRLGYRDASAVLMKDGLVVAAAEEERFNRVKASPSQLPELSVRFVLDYAGITMRDVDVVATHGITWGEEYGIALSNYLKTCFGHTPRIFRCHHHDAHAASAFFASGFDKALILTIDNSGDGVSTQISLGEAGGIRMLKRIERPNSLGLFYGMITQFCGFRRDEDEFKLMGLAPFGKPDVDLDFLLSWGGGHFELNTDYIQPIVQGRPQPTVQQAIYNNSFERKLGRRRLPGEEITQRHKDIAASAQHVLEQAVLDIAGTYMEQTGMQNICIAGGVGLNCALNRKLMNAEFTDRIFVQPASGDAGVSLGAAYLACRELEIPISNMFHVYLGQEFDNGRIEEVLKDCGVEYEKLNNAPLKTAELVASGKVVAVFQGRSEFGPRALGNRSILANPAIPGISSLVNRKIKFRENFRPLCPSVLEEDSHLYFSGRESASPYMTINFDATQLAKKQVPDVVHVDGTSRIQTVSESQNKWYHEYLCSMKKLTGHGISLNTSFNVNQQPIVNTPHDALMTFFGSGLDALVIGDHLVKK